MAGYDRKECIYGIVLHRFFVDYADQLGTVPFWEQSFKDLYNQMPFPDLWNGLDVWVWDMRHPQLPQDTLNKVSNLLDYDVNTPGYQVAAGLFTSKDKLELAVFPIGWTPDKPWGGTFSDSTVLYARNTMSHEVGHFYANQGGYETGTSYIEKKLTELFNTFVPADFQNKKGEYFAECYRGACGDRNALGKFSDGKIFYRAGGLFTLMKTWYWLVGNLKNKFIDNIQLFEDRIEWDEYEYVQRWFMWYPYWTMVKTGRYSINQFWTKNKV